MNTLQSQTQGLAHSVNAATRRAGVALSLRLECFTHRANATTGWVSRKAMSLLKLTAPAKLGRCVMLCALLTGLLWNVRADASVRAEWGRLELMMKGIRAQRERLGEIMRDPNTKTTDPAYRAAVKEDNRLDDAWWALLHLQSAIQRTDNKELAERTAKAETALKEVGMTLRPASSVIRFGAEHKNDPPVYPQRPVIRFGKEHVNDPPVYPHRPVIRFGKEANESSNPAPTPSADSAPAAETWDYSKGFPSPAPGQQAILDRSANLFLDYQKLARDKEAELAQEFARESIQMIARREPYHAPTAADRAVRNVAVDTVVEAAAQSHSWLIGQLPDEVATKMRAWRLPVAWATMNSRYINEAYEDFTKKEIFRPMDQFMESLGLNPQK